MRLLGRGPMIALERGKISRNVFSGDSVQIPPAFFLAGSFTLFGRVRLFPGLPARLLGPLRGFLRAGLVDCSLWRVWSSPWACGAAGRVRFHLPGIFSCLFGLPPCRSPGK